MSEFRLRPDLEAEITHWLEHLGWPEQDVESFLQIASDMIAAAERSLDSESPPSLIAVGRTSRGRTNVPFGDLLHLSASWLSRRRYERFEPALIVVFQALLPRVAIAQAPTGRGAFTPQAKLYLAGLRTFADHGVCRTEADDEVEEIDEAFVLSRVPGLAGTPRALAAVTKFARRFEETILERLGCPFVPRHHFCLRISGAENPRLPYGEIIESVELAGSTAGLVAKPLLRVLGHRFPRHIISQSPQSLAVRSERVEICLGTFPTVLEVAARS